MFRDLYAHMEWADAIVWRAVRSNPEAGADKRVRDLLLHLHATQRAFLTVWRKEELHFRKPESFGSMEEIERFGREFHEQAWPLLSTIDAAALDTEMNMPWAKRFRPDAASTTMRETMMQIVMHSTYHRGQVNMRLRELSVDPPLTDYIAWIWQGRPAAAW